jgi:hypothetical protein
VGVVDPDEAELADAGGHGELVQADVAGVVVAEVVAGDGRRGG